MDSVRRELLGRRVFVFLRNGKILNLARGATTIDAAFQIHTEVGLKMHGVEINGKPVPLSYELQNGDVVSILTGEGKPATDWMRYAKSRSTRSKLRSYFRARQKESLREAGKILLLDVLSVHAALIAEASYLPRDFTVPTKIEELEDFLPGKTQFEDIDDLLIAVGKLHDRTKLLRIICQLFDVPKSMLLAAEEKSKSRLPNSVAVAVQARQEKAKDAGKAAAESSGRISPRKPEVYHRHEAFTPSSQSILVGLDLDNDYADAEHVCPDCLPVFGDEIVGTRHPDAVTMPIVHRLGCPIAQRAVNQAKAKQRFPDNSVAGTSIPGIQARVDSVSLREAFATHAPWSRQSHDTLSRFTTATRDLPVRLKWADLDEKEGLFLTEIAVHCEDRKLLLADCSEVVSETVTILKTGSSSSNDGTATLVFLVQVTGIEQIQTLMNRLSQVRCVLSVERRFGSELN